MNVDSPGSPTRAATPPSPPPRDTAGSSGAGPSGAGPSHSLQAPPGLVARTVPGEASAGPSAPRTLLRPASPPAGSPGPAGPSGTADITAQPNATPAGPPAMQRLVRGRPALNHERASRLVQAQALLAQGRSYDDARREAHADRTVVRDVFDRAGRLRLTARAEALLSWNEPELVAGLRELPRALAGNDAVILAEVLRRNAAQALPDLRQAAADAGMQAAALDHLFDPQGWLRADRIDALPDDQRQMLRSALIPGGAAGPVAPAPGSQAPEPAAPLPATETVRTRPSRAQRADLLVAAQARIVAGESLEMVAPRAGVSLDALVRMMDARGRLLLGLESERFLNSLGPHMERIAAMPRALRHWDLNRLKRVLTEHAGTPQADLRAASAAEGLLPETLAYLLDGEGRIRRDRVATLPPDQQEALAPAPTAQADAAGRLAGAAIPMGRATLMAEAQAMLAAGQTKDQAAAHANCAVPTLGQNFDSQGRLLFTRQAERFLSSADADLAARFAAMPRALRPSDLASLRRLLSQHAADPNADSNADLRQACITAGMAPQARAYLLDAEGRLRADRVATLPDDQRQVLQRAMPVGTAPSAGPSAAATTQAGPSAPADRAVTAMSPPAAVVDPSAAVAVRRTTAAEEAAIQRAATFAQAHALLARGMALGLVSQQVGMTVRHISSVFNARGRLLFTPEAKRLMNCADPALVARFAAMPRAIRQGDMRHLGPLLSQHRLATLPDLREACAAAAIGPETLAYLFDADGQLRSDDFAGLPRDQQELLQHALGRDGPAHAPLAQPEPTAAPDPAASSSRPAPPLAASTPGSAADPQASTSRPPPPRPSTSRPPSSSGASTSTARPMPPARSQAAARPTPASAVRPVPPRVTASTADVLQFFRQHSHPAEAFNAARTRFDLSRVGLLQLLASAGVTELEAYDGRLPDAMTLWQRVRGGAASFTGAPSVPLWPATSAAAPATATTSAAATPSTDLANFAASLEDVLPLATPTPAATPSSSEFAASLEQALQSAAATPVATPSVLGKRPAPEPATSPETLSWGTQGARSQLPRPAGRAAVAVPPPLPEAAAPPEAADLDNLDFGLLDPGTPDWGFLDSWLTTNTGQRPPSSSAAQPAASASAAPTSQQQGDWMDALDSLDSPIPGPSSPPHRNQNPP
jgi:hypothetical protein